jgi:hypothetical protein
MSSLRILQAVALRDAGLPFVFLNARDVLFVTEEPAVGTVVQYEMSEQKLREHIAKLEAEWTGPKTSACGAPLPHVIITGYIASTPAGIATTLKRDGSDFSASIFGKMFNSIGNVLLLQNQYTSILNKLKLQGLLFGRMSVVCTLLTHVEFRKQSSYQRLAIRKLLS